MKQYLETQNKDLINELKIALSELISATKKK